MSEKILQELIGGKYHLGELFNKRFAKEDIPIDQQQNCLNIIEDFNFTFSQNYEKTLIVLDQNEDNIELPLIRPSKTRDNNVNTIPLNLIVQGSPFYDKTQANLCFYDRPYRIGRGCIEFNEQAYSDLDKDISVVKLSPYLTNIEQRFSRRGDVELTLPNFTIAFLGTQKFSELYQQASK